jgi:adenylate cyclase
VAPALLALLLAQAAAATGLLDRIDARAFDRLMRARNASLDRDRPGQVPPIAHIVIDDASSWIAEAPGGIRRAMADVVRLAAASGAAGAVLDFVFAGEQGPGDDALAAAAASARNVVVGAAFHLTSGSARTSLSVPSLEAAWPITVAGEASSVMQAVAVTPSFGGLRGQATTGALNVQPDDDGLFRRVPLVVRLNGSFYPSMALAVACSYLDVRPDQVELRPGRSVTLRNAKAPDGTRRDIAVPVDRAGAMHLDFAGSWDSTRAFRFADAWRDSLDPAAGPIWDDALRDRLVFVSEVSTARADVGATPVDPVHPLVALHATAVANIIDGRFLATAPPWLDRLVLVAALGFLAAVSTWKPRAFWAASALVVAIVAAGIVVSYVARGVMMDAAAPAAGIALLVITTGIVRYAEASRERALTRRMFESYFPPAVVARLLENRDRVAGSSRKELTVLFSDIVGFTAWSAALPPERVQQFLNEYFDRMVTIAFDNGGTVDKFIGDGLMVFFNDPDDQADHAARAVRCALAMQDAIVSIRSARGEGDPPLQVRIGVHTGTAVVGNLGSERRLSYTAVGAAVNLAQRLEAAAPPGGILVSEATARLVEGDLRVAPAGELRLKGFDQPVTVFTAGPANLEGA